MAVDRPTFHESWHRVAELKPRLRPTVQIVRQVFRGSPWHVVQDEAGTDYFRMDASAYAFVGLLDGTRTVDDCWNACNQRLGDNSPTQGEIIQLLGKLYSNNLLAADVAGETDVMLRRQSKRRLREVQNFLTNLLFMRLPILNPDRFLTRTSWLFRWCFTPLGLVVWAAAILAGLWNLVGHFGELSSDAATMLSADNLFLLYITFAVLKLIHELGHAYACKIFGQREGTHGDVRTLGIMFLVFVPFPYIDVSSAWMLRDRRKRLLVAAMGMMWELFIAAFAAIVWVRAGEGTLTKALAHNAVWVASVTTVLFNINPLLRYDGYYMLCDVLGIPNLWQRASEYVQFLVKKVAWKTPKLTEPSLTPREPFWLVTYAVSSHIYRVFVFAGIIVFVAQQFFIIGMIFAIVGATMWAIVPLGKFVNYLATSPEIARVRGRAVGSSLGVAALLIGGVGFIPAPDHVRIEGVLESQDFSVIHAGEAGFVTGFAADHTSPITPSIVLVSARNEELNANIAELEATLTRLRVLRDEAIGQDATRVQQVEAQINAVDQKLAYARTQLDNLNTRDLSLGTKDRTLTWISPDIAKRSGTFVQKGEPLGISADLTKLRVRGIATQLVAARLLNEGAKVAEIRAKARPQSETTGTVVSIQPAGTTTVPSQSLTFEAGGPIQRDVSAKSSEKVISKKPQASGGGESNAERAREPHFEWQIDLDSLPQEKFQRQFFIGQRVIARFRLPDAPLLVQGWRYVRRELQARFQV
ncbi:MAG: hypothetical protein U0640_11780 [Phycisphaerales bacterium]